VVPAAAHHSEDEPQLVIMCTACLSAYGPVVCYMNYQRPTGEVGEPSVMTYSVYRKAV
jgi:hypothetical protein